MAKSNPPYDPCTDEHFMRRAIELARQGQGAVEPNPMVGCVLVRDGAVIGQGYHRAFGGPHAEVEAIRSLAAGDAAGATAYVSLEPCCHHGKTPPCTDALITAGVARVVVAMGDPYPRVSGRGLNQLRDAGIEVTAGVLEEEATALCAPYLKRLRTGKPWVIAKWAMTIDGRIATVAGESQWITGEAARLDVHRLRSRVDAIAVGMGTVVADNPMLNSRLDQSEGSAQRIASRVVFCRNRLPSADCQLVATAREIPLLLIVGPAVDARQLEQLQSLGAEVIPIDTEDPSAMVNLALDELGNRALTNLIVEGGGELLASFFSAGQIDECHVYLGPRIFGGNTAPGPIGGPGITNLAESPRFRLMSIEQIDGDVKVIYRRTSG